MTRDDVRWVWEVADDADEVHDLLQACDRHQAAESGTPVPARRRATTLQRVGDGHVHLLRRPGDAAAAMFTLTPQPPFRITPGTFGEAIRPLYLHRFAMRPDLLAGGTTLGIRCARKAVELAAAAGADVLRCEANPDLTVTRELLGHLGFHQCGPEQRDAGVARVYLERQLRPAHRISG